MAESKANGIESEQFAEDPEQFRTSLTDAQNDFWRAQAEDPQPHRHERNAELARVKSARLGTPPELAALGDFSHSKRARGVAAHVTPPTPLKLRLSVASSGNATIAVSGSASGGGARLRPKPPSPAPPPPRPAGSSLFGSCFPRSSTFPALISAGKSPTSPPSPHRKRASPTTRHITVDDSARAVAAPALRQDVLDSTSNQPVAAEVAADSPRSPSCRCSTESIEAENAAAKSSEQSDVALEPQGAIAGDSASMSKAENDPGLAGGQQLQQQQQQQQLSVLNAEPESLIAAVKLTDESESRQPSPESSRPSHGGGGAAAAEARQQASGVSPIRGLRPSYVGETPRPAGRRPRSDSADEDPSPRARKSPYEGRSRSPQSAERFAPQATARGVERLFDSIIGRADNSRGKEQALSQSPKRLNRKQHHHPKHFRNASKHRRERESADDDRAMYESPRGVEQQVAAQNHGPPEASSSSRGHTFSGLSDLPGTSMLRDEEMFPVGGREQQQQQPVRDAFGTVRSNARSPSAGDVRWKRNDHSRESGHAERKKDPRRRGHPDPSFNPRPGDIIIRARKRAGLRLTDFYYYDNENYMEPGDQILRAKFDYLPPMDKMYLWCRLYVYSANNTYTFLDSTSESIGKLGTAEAGVDTRSLNSGHTFMGN